MPTPGKGYWLDGKRLPSVTTINKKFSGSDALVGWAYGKGYDDALEGRERNRYAASEEAKDIGTYAHAMIQAHLHGIALPQLPDYARLPKLDFDELTKAEMTRDAYLAWEKHTGLQVVSLEIPLMSRLHRYGGTPDAIGEIDFDLALVDFKTANGVYVENLEQLAAYIALWDENHPERPIRGGAHLLRLPKEGGDFHHHFYADLGDAWQSFLHKRELYDIHARLEKRVK